MYVNDTDLSNMKCGESARIVEIDGGHGIRQKLNLRGINEGTVIRVISTSGPVTIEIDRSLVSIGRGMARRIKVIRT